MGSSPGVVPLLLLLFAPLRPASAQETGPPALDTLVAGGDTVLARWEHDLVARHGAAWPLREVAGWLAGADAALCNLECCIALGGEPAAKGERCPFYYRARPEMLQVLLAAGVDAVTGANNHGGDYGPLAVAETLRWTGEAGLVCAGLGEGPAAAEAPRLLQVGRTRVALVGVDATMKFFQAAPGRPGSCHLRGPGELAAAASRAAAWAAGRADLVALTIHWGDNWVRETPARHREMARAALAAGVDLILGHSAHRLQGIEVIDGKPVLYDMGNLLFDCQLSPEGRQTALFRLHLSPEGVRRLEILPALALEGRTVPAAGEEAEAILAEVEALSAPFGTALARERDEAGRPVGVVEVAPPVQAGAAAPARRPPAARAAPAAPGPGRSPALRVRAEGVLVAQPPADAVRLEPPAALAPGVELVGFRLPATAAEGGILPVHTWWRVTRPVAAHWLVACRLETAGRVSRRGTAWYNRHDPGDWTMPLERLRPGEIAADLFPARLSGLPAGPCRVEVLVLDPAAGEAALGPVRLLGTVEVQARSASRPGKEGS